MKYETKVKNADLVIVGAGAAGICAALQAARMGVHTVLINDRGVVGGNNSCEINVSLGGACDGNALNLNAREGGIIDELKTEYKFRSPHSNRYALDAIYMERIYDEGEHLCLFLNTCIDEVETDESGNIVCVRGTQNTTETRWEFRGRWFVDDTGDGALGALAGAQFMLGREAASTFGEKIAPEKADTFCIPSTLYFEAKDMGFPVQYHPPKYADDIERSGALLYRTIPHERFNLTKWYYEGSGELDQVKDREEIIRRHRGLISGIWNYIKNSGKYPEALNYDFEYISCIPGVREYRRLVGDFVLTEHELIGQEEYDDAVGHGGWNIDLHAIKGFYDTDLINRHIHFQGPYQIPYRAGYSRNVQNLFMCGRCMSTSHVAFGSTRVAATLSTLGQAVGMAAAICKEHDTTPRGVYEHYRKELQQRLLREDQLILGVRNEDPADHALRARVTASSVLPMRLWPDEGLAFTPLGLGLALSLPVCDRMDEITLSLRVKKDTALAYRIYKPSKPYNFGPDVCVAEKSIPLQAGEGKTALPLGIADGGSYYFLELCGNEEIEVLTCDTWLPTTLMFTRYKNSASNVWDYATMQAREYGWARSKRCACFTVNPEQDVYGPNNIVNGYNRACGQPNLWMSAPGDVAPEVRLHWEDLVELSTVQITFFIDTTVTVHHFELPVFPGVAMEYRIYACTGDTETLVAAVKDNHAKFRRHTFTPIRCDSLRIVFDNGYDGHAVGVQEIRAE